MYRENHTNESDTGWKFLAGSEDEQYIADSGNFEIYELNTICNYDKAVIPYLNMPIGIKLEKQDNKFIEIN